MKTENIQFYSYLNPFDDRFKSIQDFKKLNNWQKAGVVVATTFASAMTCFIFGVGGIAVFRLLVGKYRIEPYVEGKESKIRQSTEKAKNVGQQIGTVQSQANPSSSSFSLQVKQEVNERRASREGAGETICDLPNLILPEIKPFRTERTIRSLFEEINKETGKGSSFKYFTNLPDDADVGELQMVIFGEVHDQANCKEYFTALASKLPQAGVFFSENVDTGKDLKNKRYAGDHVDTSTLPEQIEYCGWDINRDIKESWWENFESIFCFLCKEVFNDIEKNQQTDKYTINSIDFLLDIHRELIDSLGIPTLEQQSDPFHKLEFLEKLFRLVWETSSSQQWLLRQNKIVENLESALSKNRCAILCAGGAHVTEKNGEIDRVLRSFLTRNNKAKYLIVYLDCDTSNAVDRYADIENLNKRGVKPIVELIEKTSGDMNKLLSRVKKNVLFTQTKKEVEEASSQYMSLSKMLMDNLRQIREKNHSDNTAR